MDRPGDRRVRLRMPRPLALVLALVLVLVLGATVADPLPAQQLRPGLLVGRITGPDGEPVAGAILRATQGARTLLAETEDDGDFRLGGLDAGVWTIAIRRLGFRPLVVELELPASGLRRDLALEPTTVALDPVLVAAKWTGIRGVVGDARRIAPLAGATVRVLGADGSAGSDTLGNFALPVEGGRSVVLRVERTGFETRLITARVPREGYLELDVPLDTALRDAKDAWVWRDLDQRLKFATPRAARITREEIEETDAFNLGGALPLTDSAIRAGLVINRRACVFVNGVAKPGFPVDAILAGEVEFVEVYPPGAELTRTLALRWPPNAPCGVPDGTMRAPAAGARQVAQFVSVWLRQP